MNINGKRLKISPSKVNLFTDCRRCFYLDVHGLWKRPPSPFPTLPSGIDRVLKDHFDFFRKNGGVPEELKEIVGVSLYMGPELDVWRGDFQGIRYNHPSGIEIQGIVDDILEKDGKLLVFDFKTKGSAPHENSAKWYVNQMNFYVYLLKKNNYPVHDYAYLCFYYPEEVLPDGRIVFGKKLSRVDTQVDRVESIIEDLKTVLEGPIPKEGCQWCQWFGPNKEEVSSKDDEKEIPKPNERKYDPSKGLSGFV